MGVNVSALGVDPLTPGRSISRYWTLHLTQLALIVAGVVLRIVSILIGAHVARFIAPDLIDNGAMHVFTLTCLTVLIPANLVRIFLLSSQELVITLLWLALLLGFGTTCHHRLEDLEALSAWFLTVQATTAAVNLITGKLQKGVLILYFLSRTISFIVNC